MRITPLHNIREPGLIPNGFQREQAPPPAPDPAMQPEMRNRVEAQTDTRHAVEFLNPRTRLEANAANRTNMTAPPRTEMGRAEEKGRPETGSALENTQELHASYERLLRILLGQGRPAGQTAAPPGPGEAHRAPVSEPFAGRRPLRIVVETRLPDRAAEGSVSYYHRRGVEAYRLAQALYPGGGPGLEA